MRLSAWLPAAALLALTACERTPPPVVALRIGVFQTQDVLPYIVIRERGLDKKHGLQFTETTFAGGAAAIDAMAVDLLDLSPVVGTVPLLAAAERGLVPGKVVGVAANNFADPQHPGAGVVAASSVGSWQDLAGKKIGVNARISISTAAVDARLKALGIGGYSFVEMPFSNMGLAVSGGNVAAAAMNEPHLTQSLLRGDGTLLGWVVGGPPLERAEFTAIVFSAEFLRRNPEGVKAYLRAHLAAVRWIGEYPEEARALLGRHLNLSAEVMKKIRLMRWPADARSDPSLLEETQQMLIRAGVQRRPVDTRTLHDETLLSEVLKEKR